MKTSKRVWAGALILLIVAGLGAGSFFFVQYRQDVALKREQARASINEAKRLETAATDDGKVVYFTNVSAAYMRAGDHDQALENILKADSYIKDRSASGSTVNINIAEIYQAMGDNDKAREYYEKEISRLKGSDNDEAIRYIRGLEANL